MSDSALLLEPAPLHPAIYQDRARRCSHTELHPSHPFLRKTTSPQDVPEVSPINRIISLREVHLPEEANGTRAARCRHYLLDHHDAVYHLSPRDEGRLKWADQAVHHFTEAISQDLGYDEVYGIGQRNGTEVTDLFCSWDLQDQDQVYLVELLHLTSAGMEVSHHSHHFRPQHIPTLFIKEYRYPIGARSALAVQTPNSSLDLFEREGTG